MSKTILRGEAKISTEEAKTRAMLLGSLLSIAAAAIIEYLLVILLLGESIEALFRPPSVAAMIILVAIGVAVYYYYTASTTHAHNVMKKISPLALILASAGIAVGALSSPTAGAALIVAAYLVELAVGTKLAKDYAQYSGKGAKLFLAGVTGFVATLPLAAFNPLLAALPLAANTVKTVGLTAIALQAAKT